GDDAATDARTAVAVVPRSAPRITGKALGMLRTPAATSGTMIELVIPDDWTDRVMNRPARTAMKPPRLERMLFTASSMRVDTSCFIRRVTRISATTNAARPRIGRAHV